MNVICFLLSSSSFVLLLISPLFYDLSVLVSYIYSKVCMNLKHIEVALKCIPINKLLLCQFSPSPLSSLVQCTVGNHVDVSSTV